MYVYIYIERERGQRDRLLYLPVYCCTNWLVQRFVRNSTSQGP